MRIVGTIEARMGSTRLPGKTLMNIYREYSLLECVVMRFRRCRLVDEVCVATTTSRKDDPIAEWCSEHRVDCYRGSEEDVLDRVTKTAQKLGADAIVQMGADSAYLDFKLIDELVGYYGEGDYDYVCNDMELTYPLGIYAHVVKFPVLAQMNRNRGLSTRDREDVVRHIFENPSRYSILNVEAPSSLSFPGLRLTIDYPEDMNLAGVIYDHFKSPLFSTRDVIDLYGKRPEIFEATLQLHQVSAPFLDSRSGYGTTAGRSH